MKKEFYTSEQLRTLFKETVEDRPAYRHSFYKDLAHAIHLLKEAGLDISYILLPQPAGDVFNFQIQNLPYRVDRGGTVVSTDLIRVGTSYRLCALFSSVRDKNQKNQPFVEKDIFAIAYYDSSFPNSPNGYWATAFDLEEPDVMKKIQLDILSPLAWAMRRKKTDEWNAFDVKPADQMPFSQNALKTILKKPG